MKQSRVAPVLLSMLVAAFFLVSFAGAMPLVGSYPGPDTLPNGLKLTDFQVQAPSVPVKSGQKVHVSFRIVNTSESTIQISSSYGVFVGSRWNSASDANNRDFGHNYKGTVLMPLQGIVLSAERIVDTPGTWRFWPAFNIAGKWGPFRWHEIVVNVEQGPPPSGPRPTRPPPSP